MARPILLWGTAGEGDGTINPEPVPSRCWRVVLYAGVLMIATIRDVVGFTITT